MVKKSSQLIHVKLDYEEARESKRDMLSLELDLVKIMRAMKKYRFLRSEELKLKKKLKIQISEFIKEVRKLRVELPKLEIPHILKDHYEEDEDVTISKHVIEDDSMKELKRLEKKMDKNYEDDLEKELREIKERLKEMGNR